MTSFGSITATPGDFGAKAFSVDRICCEGTSMLKHDDSQVDRPDNSWSQCDPSSFQLRVGPRYDKNKKKGPSPPALMEIVGVDCFQTGSKIDNVASKVNIPHHWTTIDTHHASIPQLFIVNVQIPSDFSTSFFREITDGPGWSLVIYFRITEAAAASFADLSSASGAERLFAQYCMHAPELDGSSSNPWKGRFKVALRCNNIDQFGLPSFITSYNAKPVLIKNTGKLIRCPMMDIFTRGANYIEMDINVHNFASLPKKALKTLIERFDQMSIDIGFCIESRDDGDMPETLFGCLNLHKPSIRWPEWVPGKVYPLSTAQKAAAAAPIESLSAAVSAGASASAEGAGATKAGAAVVFEAGAAAEGGRESHSTATIPVSATASTVAELDPKEA